VSGASTGPAAGQVFAATLTITTNDSQNASIRLPVSLTAHGGNVSVGTSVGPSVDLGSTPVGTTAVGIVSVANNGNADVTISFPGDGMTAFGLAWPNDAGVGPMAVRAGAGVLATATFKPTATGQQFDDKPFTVTGPVCGTQQTTVHMMGNGT
jgi:hypothetical protein